MRPAPLSDRCYNNQFCLKFIHKTLLRYLLTERNDHSMISARKQGENARMLPPTCSLIFPVCLKWSQLLIFSSSVIRDVRTEGKWTITWCVVAYGSSLLSDVTGKAILYLCLLKQSFVVYVCACMRWNIHATAWESQWNGKWIKCNYQLLYAQTNWICRVTRLHNQT